MKEINEFLKIPEIVKEFDLKSMIKILRYFENPQKHPKTIHVAGTNGKGSVCAFIAQGLQQAGYKTGLYTSPHLSDITERIQVNNKKISKKDFVKILKKLKATAKKYSIQFTFFEYLTAIAFIYFKEQKVEYLVLETGLGGRLDATNICTPKITIITNIAVDHTRHLGKNIISIAKEKAGIIKKNIPIITRAKGKALKVIKQQARKKKSRFIVPRKRKESLSLKSDFQQENAALARQTLALLGINEDIITKAFKKTIWPGRFELKGNILLDCAHNPRAANVLAKEIKKLNKKIVLILGIMHDKNIPLIIKPLKKLTKKVILTKPNNKRAAETKELARYVKAIEIPNVKQAIQKAKQLRKKNELILITGSLFTVAEARRILKFS